VNYEQNDKSAQYDNVYAAYLPHSVFDLHKSKEKTLVEVKQKESKARIEYQKHPKFLTL
jgi:hypothetical protein